VGSYDSDGEEDPAPQGTLLPRPPALEQKTAEPQKEEVLPDADPEPQEEHPSGLHGPDCECEHCEMLMLRFMAKNLQTKGIRFKCKLSGALFQSKAAAAAHFRKNRAIELQAFKKAKMPSLFQIGPSKEQLAAIARQKAFARDCVLGKRPVDEDWSFGGWAKKEKPLPPPCETPEYEGMMNAPVFTAPPWEGQAKPTDDDATEIDKEIDQRVNQAQTLRFCKRNVLEVKKDLVRCKLCYKTLPNAFACEEHIVKEHEDDFQKEQKIWERFLFTVCKRQPPFGWQCKICSIFFASDGACWRHVGKEVYIRQEERHMSMWHEKEDRWGHAEDEECCGDGMNVGRGLSYESVLAFN